MINFCTLFDSKYLSRGLILYDSLKENESNFHLYIFAFDDLCLKILIKLNLTNVTVIPLKDFENERLISIKGTRTNGEYCWTCTSSIIEYVFENFKVASCTYIDADLLFYSSPSVLLKEMKHSKSVLITEHRFSGLASLFEKKRAGRFCVQFITFNNERESREILSKWINQCIDWCYARYEDGKFGDQKYLENWPEEYKNVHVLENIGGGVAPWNVRKYKFLSEANKIYVIDSGTKSKSELIFFHFHFVKILPDNYADLGWNRLRKDVVDLFYVPYIQRINKKEKFLEQSFSEYKSVFSSDRPHGIRETFKYHFKTTTKFNLLKFKTI